MKELELLRWFEKKARPFFNRHANDRLAALESDYARLKRLLSSPDTVTVCLLGNSGIGKSTLLNALAAGSDQVLPAGGIGPLTAQATEVHYSSSPTFKVVYHPRKNLWKVAFALEQRLESQSRAAKKAEDETVKVMVRNDSKDLEALLDDEDRTEALAMANHIVGADDAPPEDPLEGVIKQAKQIITGNQFSSQALPYLVDALRLACSQKPRWQQEIDSGDMQRIERIKQAFEQTKKDHAYERTQTDDPAAFRSELKAHAAGFLSPLIERIYVGWPSAVLKSGVILVDLPGVGIAQDSYRNITKKYVRDQARAVILVVDRAGPTESTVELLRESGYWNRLVGAADDPSSDPCSMLMAVTRVDDVAQEEWQNLEVPEGTTKPKKREVFLRLIGEFQPRMRAQITEQLGKIGGPNSESEAVQTARDQARANILGSLEVHPVSAPELRKLLIDDEDDRPFLQNEEQTGIPELQQSLIRLAQSERESRSAARKEVSSRLASASLNELRIIDGQWRQEGRAAEEAQRLEAALEVILGPKRKEYDRRVGAFREFLDETVQAKIEALVLEARSVAETEVQNYLWSLQGAHWATLRAAVRRGGAFYGSRSINLPDDISNYFQEPMAAVWGQKLLRDIRKRTSELSSDIETMVEEICQWANENGGASVNAKLLQNQQERVASLAAQMKQVGKEAVDELRETVKVRLTEVIRKPIAAACTKFVKEGDDIGPGVKSRILVMFRQLAEKATKSAQQPAVDILQANFAEVRLEIQESFKQGGDPIQTTADLIVESHEARQIRSDAQKRGPILKELAAVFDSYTECEDVDATSIAV